MQLGNFKFLILLTLLIHMSGVGANILNGKIELSNQYSLGTGDVVGNGDISLDDFLSDGKNSFFSLKEEEINFRNDEFEYILDYLELDPLASGTGDVVGNGGGYIESLTYYYYQTLARHISSSLAQSYIVFTKYERRVLEGLLQQLPSMRGDKIRFVGGKKAKVLFYIAGRDASPRLAKTGFSTAFPIYFNIDLLNKEVQGRPELLLGLLVHELGHQLGIADHGVLDNLGAKVVQVASSNDEKISAVLPEGELELTIQNHYKQSGPSDIYVSYGENEVKTLKWKTAEIHDLCGDDETHSAVVYNLHWTSRLFDHGPDIKLTANSWLDVKCFNAQSGMFRGLQKNLEISIEANGKKINGNLKVLN